MNEAQQIIWDGTIQDIHAHPSTRDVLVPAELLLAADAALKGKAAPEAEYVVAQAQEHPRERITRAWLHDLGRLTEALHDLWAVQNRPLPEGAALADAYRAREESERAIQHGLASALRALFGEAPRQDRVTREALRYLGLRAVHEAPCALKGYNYRAGRQEHEECSCGLDESFLHVERLITGTQEL